MQNIRNTDANLFSGVYRMVPSADGSYALKPSRRQESQGKRKCCIGQAPESKQIRKCKTSTSSLG